VVIAIIIILASLLLPAIAKAKIVGQSASCLNNFKQLQLGYQMYADDNRDSHIPYKVQPGPAGEFQSLPGSWVVGSAQA